MPALRQFFLNGGPLGKHHNRQATDQEHKQPPLYASGAKSHYILHFKFYKAHKIANPSPIISINYRNGFMNLLKFDS
jgi:hypothetical protein